MVDSSLRRWLMKFAERMQYYANSFDRLEHASPLCKAMVLGVSRTTVVVLGGGVGVASVDATALDESWKKLKGVWSRFTTDIRSTTDGGQMWAWYSIVSYFDPVPRDCCHYGGMYHTEEIRLIGMTLVHCIRGMVLRSTDGQPVRELHKRAKEWMELNDGKVEEWKRYDEWKRHLAQNRTWARSSIPLQMPLEWWQLVDVYGDDTEAMALHVCRIQCPWELPTAYKKWAIMGIPKLATAS